MSTPPTITPQTITYEQMMAMFLETREQFAETRTEAQERLEASIEASRAEARERLAESRAESQKQIAESRAEAQKEIAEIRRLLKESDNDRKKSRKDFDKRMAKLGDRIGDLIESMVRGGIIRLFRAQGYSFTCCSRNLEFRNSELGVAGEIDLFLENGEYALLVEVKTNTSIEDIRGHIERLKKYRLVADARGDSRRFIAAIGGGVVREEMRDFAVQRGLYVILQSGENVKVIPPVGKPQEW